MDEFFFAAPLQQSVRLVNIKFTHPVGHTVVTGILLYSVSDHLLVSYPQNCQTAFKYSELPPRNIQVLIAL